MFLGVFISVLTATRFDDEHFLSEVYLQDGDVKIDLRGGCFEGEGELSDLYHS